MNSRLNALQYERSYNYMSKDLPNVMRDWVKVVKYSKRLGILPDDYEMNMTNDFLAWDYDDQENVDGNAKQ
jgi:pyrimidine precursor biosynthesis enzyme